MQSIGDRMKGYEVVTRHTLTRRTPVIVRVDGRAFHTWTKGLTKPFDERFINAMVTSSMYLFREMQGCRIAYIQSDEASFLLTDFSFGAIGFEPWFGYVIQKMTSISASIMSTRFIEYWGGYEHLMGKPNLVFDSRVFNIPANDVVNYFYWRFLDWRRNSVQMLARNHFSHKQLINKNQDQMKQMLGEIKRPWEQLSDREKNGTWLYKDQHGSLHDGSSIVDMVDIATLINPYLES